MVALCFWSLSFVGDLGIWNAMAGSGHKFAIPMIYCSPLRSDFPDWKQKSGLDRCLVPKYIHCTRLQKWQPLSLKTAPEVMPHVKTPTPPPAPAPTATHTPSAIPGSDQIEHFSVIPNSSSCSFKGRSKAFKTVLGSSENPCWSNNPCWVSRGSTLFWFPLPPEQTPCSTSDQGPQWDSKRKTLWRFNYRHFEQL